MDSSLQSTHLALNTTPTSTPTDHAEDTVAAEEEHHIHLPNPSVWPVVLSIAILVAITGLFFLPDNPWLTIVAAPFVLIGILGWALEDPMAASKVELVPVTANSSSKYLLGQDVVEKSGNWIGVVQGRFAHYILIDRGDVFSKAYYVPHSVIQEMDSKGALHLSINESDLQERGLDRVPDDLYEEVPQYGAPKVTGVPLYAQRPLSPAETGHYNYGPNFPGINTDASGSYRPDEVRPTPQKYVAARNRNYATRKSIPPRVVSSN